jgi:hypothetical protein
VSRRGKAPENPQPNGCGAYSPERLRLPRRCQKGCLEEGMSKEGPRGMIDLDTSAEEFFAYLKELDALHGRIACLNFLTITQSLTLPDALLFYDCFIKL